VRAVAESGHEAAAVVGSGGVGEMPAKLGEFGWQGDVGVGGGAGTVAGVEVGLASRPVVVGAARSMTPGRFSRSGHRRASGAPGSGPVGAPGRAQYGPGRRAVRPPPRQVVQ
jgi:hypothetical protein